MTASGWPEEGEGCGEMFVCLARGKGRGMDG